MLKVALIGAGRMGRVHLDVYKSLPDVKVVALVDIEENAVGAAARGPDTKLYKSVETLLENEQLDMADICSPTYMHAEQAVKLMEHGIPVICEKPLSLDVESARRMADAAKRNNVYFMAAQVIRFWPEYEYLKKVYDEGTYGKLNQILFSRVGEMTKTSWKDWMREMDKSGRAAVDLHIHDADFIMHLLGKPKGVTSFAREDGYNISWINTHYDYGDVMVEAEGGWYGPAFPFSMSYRASFERAVLEYRNSKLMVYEDGKEPGQVNLEDVKADAKLNVGSVNGYKYEIEYFINCVRNNTPPRRITPDESIACLEMVFKELESARTGRKVLL